MMLQIIAEDIYKLQDTLNEFSEDCPGGNPYVHDEYNIAVSLKEAVENK
jgi:hypothetical protein